MRLFQSKEEKDAIAKAEVAYGGVISTLQSDPAWVLQLPARLDQIKARAMEAKLPTKDYDRLRAGLIEPAVDAVLADDLLSEAEETALFEALDRLGVTDEILHSNGGAILDRLMVAKVNDGRLPAIEHPHLMAQPGEVVHLETNAQLMKVVAIREWQSGSHGVSFRIMKGVTYRTGVTRGKMVTTGSTVEVADAGALSVTDRRIVFTGQTKTLEFRFDKLAAMELFSDGVRLGVTNRQTTSTFTLDHVDSFAAIVNAAAQRHDA
jgi:hypothetical protein